MKKTVSKTKPYLTIKKTKLVKYAAWYCADSASSKSGKVGNHKHMKMGKDQSLNAAVMKWYIQQHSNGVNFCGVEIMAAAAKLAAHLSITDFKDDGWLWQF